MERNLIMVIDDDEAICSALSELLETEGYRVVVAPDGNEALVRLSGGELPQVILLDLMMPVGDGWKFRAEQLVNPALASIPVIVITAVTSPARRESLGVATLTKPLDTQALLAAVRQHCVRGHRDAPLVSSGPSAQTSE